MAEEKIDIKVLIDDSKAEKSLKDLQAQLKKLEDAADKVGEGAEGFNDLKDAIDKTKKSILDETIAAAQNAKSMGELRRAMQQLKTAQEGVDESSPDFDRLVDAINETEGRVGDLNDQFKTFAGSGVERAKQSTNLLAEGFQNLDVEKVNIGFKGLAKTIQGAAGSINKINPLTQGFGKSMTNLTGGFKTFAKGGIGSVVSALGQLAKAILTNPILLLAAVVIAIVVAMVKFYDKIKPIKWIVEQVGKAIDVVVQALKDFGDWLGITSFAAEEAAQKQEDSAKKVQKAVEQRYDREIAIAGAAGENTDRIEAKKIKAVKQSVQSQINALYKLKALNGELDDDQKARLQELKDALYELDTEAAVLRAKQKKEAEDNKKKVEDNAKKVRDNANKLAADRKQKAEEEKKAQEDANKKLREQIEDQNAELIKDEEDKEQRKLYLQNKRAAEEIKNSKASAEQKAAALKTLEEKYESDFNEIADKYQKARDEKKKDKDEKDKTANQQKLDDIAAATKSAQDFEIYELQKALNEKLELYKTDAEMQKILYDKFESDKKDIEDKYRKEKEAKDKEAADKLREAKQKELDDTIAFAQAGADAVMNLTDAIFSNKLSKAEKGSDEELRIAQKQFEINKKMQLAQAIITGIQSVMAAYRNGMENPIPLLGPATAGIYAGIAAITAAANVGKIAATKFDSSSFGPQPGTQTTPSPGDTTKAAGNFNPATLYTLGSATPMPSNNNNGQSVVYVGDINKVQNRVQVIENRATLGQ